jgi:hypothetical protein
MSSTPAGKRKPPGATTRGGWGHVHQQRRRQLEPIVRAGAATCARCGNPIQPNEPWALDHNDARTGYLGASHASCNARAAARKANSNRHRLPVTRIVSQRLLNDPEPGTVIHVDNQHADYYDGRQWRTVNKRELAL